MRLTVVTGEFLLNMRILPKTQISVIQLSITCNVFRCYHIFTITNRDLDKIQQTYEDSYMKFIIRYLLKVWGILCPLFCCRLGWDVLGWDIPSGCSDPTICGCHSIQAKMEKRYTMEKIKLCLMIYASSNKIIIAFIIFLKVFL